MKGKKKCRKTLINQVWLNHQVPKNHVKGAASIFSLHVVLLRQTNVLHMLFFFLNQNVLT